MTTTKKTRGPMTKASKARFEQGVSLICKQEIPGEPVPFGIPGRPRKLITEFQYPLGATIEQKVEMLEARIKDCFQEWQFERECLEGNKNRFRDDLLQSERRLQAALGMIRAFQIIPGSNDFDDGIPF